MKHNNPSAVGELKNCSSGYKEQGNKQIYEEFQNLFNYNFGVLVRIYQSNAFDD
jgi:hypothetical protein